jgi:hypothetical protein
MDKEIKSAKSLLVTGCFIIPGIILVVCVLLALYPKLGPAILNSIQKWLTS